MAYYFCIAVGMADFMPDTQEYYCAESETQMRALINDACAAFDYEDEGATYAHTFRMPCAGEDNYSQRLRISRDTDRVLDVIGITEAHYNLEQDIA